MQAARKDVRRPQVVKNRVAELREAKGLSKTELSRAAGISLQTLTKMEAGTSTKRFTRVKVAKALGVRYEEAFPNNGD